MMTMEILSAAQRIASRDSERYEIVTGRRAPWAGDALKDRTIRGR